MEATKLTRHIRTALAFAIALSVVVITPSPAQAAVSRDVFEDCLLDRLNEERADHGRVELQMAYDLVPDVRDWSQWMRYNDFVHMPSSVRNNILPNSTTSWGENIAMHSWENMPDCEAIHRMWMNSQGHRENILRSSFRYVAIGTYVDGSGWWATQLFFDASDFHATCDGTFCDDDGSIFENSIERIAAAGITYGCNPPVNSLFCPDDRVTRGAMAAFLTRALNLEESSGIDFVDDEGSVFENAIERLAAAGITQGCNPPANTHFCPDDYVTRGQMAAFLTRALQLSASDAVDFTDDDGSIFENSIQAIATEGITQGCNPPANTHFCPDDYVTRGQMAAFLTRALGH
jgi:uncharacterized protein YkwD